MLPNRNSPDFPNALREARLALNKTRSEFSADSKVHRTLIRRYELTSISDFKIPSDVMWKKLNDTVIRLNAIKYPPVMNMPWIQGSEGSNVIGLKTRWVKVIPYAAMKQMALAA